MAFRVSRTDGRLAGGGSGADARVPGGGAGTVGNLQRKLKEVEADIREDKLGQKEYEDTLDRLQRRRADLQKRVEENEDYISGFEQDMKPFLQKYEALVADIDTLYADAKEKHSQGLLLLIRDFAYHPAYKRWSDNFTAMPFKPK